STGPNLRYGNALRRFGYGPETTRFYDEHVTADESHGRIAANDLAASFAKQKPAHAGDVLFGAAALLFLEGRFADRLLSAWAQGRSSLHTPLPQPLAV
ncbi:MAG: iron-containing redox enzyme family protein, partial [Actinomycetota bacterium]